MESERFPGKTLKTFPKDGKNNWPVLYWVVAQCKRTSYPVIVCTSTNKADDAIEEYCREKLPLVPLFRGHPTDVLDRLYQAAKAHSLDRIIRITGDCPFICAEPIEDIATLRKRRWLDYASNVDPPSWPDGLDCQIVTMHALERAWNEAVDPTDRDTVLQYMVHNRAKFLCGNLPCQYGDLSAYRWVVDTEDDYERLSELVRISGHELVPGFIDIHQLLEYAPEPDRNVDLRNQRYLGHRAKELAARSFNMSTIRSSLVRKIQPYGASTYSKSHVAWGEGGPLLLTHSQGSRVWDVDGNEFIDMTAALGTNLLGFCNPRINDAIRRMMESGTNFPLAHEYEAAVAKGIINRVMYDCDINEGNDAGEYKLIFGKNGSDVTSAAVRVARVATGRMGIGVLETSYHGWHEWALMYTHRGYGCSSQDVHRCSVHELISGIVDNRFAAVIVEPDKIPGIMLGEIMLRAKRSGTLVIFDEMVTAFRYPKHTFAAFYGFDPDLICLGKALGNGMPVTALIGRGALMDQFVAESNSLHKSYAFYSGTHFGEMLSIAAAGAVCQIMDNEQQALLCLKAAECANMIGKAVETHEGVVKAYPGVMFTGGDGAILPRIEFQGLHAAEAAMHFRRHMANQGVLLYSMFLPTLAHSEADLRHVRAALHASLEEMNTKKAPWPAPEGSKIMRS